MHDDLNPYQSMLAVSFNYVDSSKEEVSMNISRNGNKKNGATFRTNNMDITPDQMRYLRCQL